MKTARNLPEEILLSLGIAGSFGAWTGAETIWYAADVRAILGPLAAGIIWWMPALAGVWILQWVIAGLGRLEQGERLSRASARRRLRPLHAAWLGILQPTFTYFIYGPLLVLLLVAGLLWRQWARVLDSEQWPDKRRQWEARLTEYGDFRLGGLFALIFFLLYLIVASGLLAELPEPGGDEPHYLVLSWSMLQDGDVLLTDDYRDNEYHRWHTGYLQAHTKMGTEGMEQQFSMHNAGVPAWLLPFMAIGSLFDDGAALLLSLRIGMIIIAAAFCGMLYVTLCRVLGSRLRALVVSCICALTVPVLFFSYHIFTELSAALLLITAFYLLWNDSSPAFLQRLLLGLCLGALPWVGVKYFTLLAPMLVLWLSQELRWGIDLRRICLVILPGSLLGGFFFLTTYGMFGTLSPSAYYFGAGGGMMQENIVFRVSQSGDVLHGLYVTVKAALAYLIDQREGLLFYSPWLLFGIAGLASLVRRGKEERRLAIWLLAVSIPFFLLYSMSGWGGGHSPPARAMTPIIWVFAIGAAASLKSISTAVRELFAGLVAVSLLFSGTLLALPRFLYHDFHVKSSHILDWLSGPFLNLVGAAPSVNNKHYENWPVVLLWVAGLTALCVWIVFSRRLTGQQKHSAGISMLLLSSLLIIIALFSLVPPTEGEAFQIDGSRQWYFTTERIWRGEDQVWLRTATYTEVYVIENEERPRHSDRLNILLRSPVPNEVIAGAGEQKVATVFDRPGSSEITLALERGLKRGTFRVRRFSIHSLGGNPAGLALPSGDRRPLGVAIRPAR